MQRAFEKLQNENELLKSENKNVTQKLNKNYNIEKIAKPQKASQTNFKADPPKMTVCVFNIYH